MSPEVVEAILLLRQELATAGHDAGAQTIAHHLTAQFAKVPSRPTIWRVLKSNGLITAQPHKRPKSSLKRFEAELPNEMWQADSTHWLLADGSHVEILNLIDDHSRFSLASVAVSTLIKRFLTKQAPRSRSPTFNCSSTPSASTTTNKDPHRSVDDRTLRSLQRPGQGDTIAACFTG